MNSVWITKNQDERNPCPSPVILADRDPGNRHARRVELDLRHRRNARRGVERHLRNHRTWLPNPVHTCDT